MKKFDMLVHRTIAMVAAQVQQSNELERVQAASRKFGAAVSGRDINAIDTVWAHESYASFIGPLSTKGGGRLGRRSPSLANAIWPVRPCQYFDERTAHSC